jgi:cytochrome c553
MKRTLLTLGIVASLGIFGAVQAGGDAAAEKTNAGVCVDCHGAHGEGVWPDPALAGMSESEFMQAIKDFRSGKRVNPMMTKFASQLSDQDAANLAAYFASLKKK